MLVMLVKMAMMFGDGDDVGDGDLCFVQNCEVIDHLYVMLAVVMELAINCDGGIVGEKSNELLGCWRSC